jgi:hypothetical protein
MRGLLRACVLVVVVFRAIRRGSARIAVALKRGATGRTVLLAATHSVRVT